MGFVFHRLTAKQDEVMFSERQRMDFDKAWVTDYYNNQISMNKKILLDKTKISQNSLQQWQLLGRQGRPGLLLNILDHGFSNCDMYTTYGTQKVVRWYAIKFIKMIQGQRSENITPFTSHSGLHTLEIIESCTTVL